MNRTTITIEDITHQLSKTGLPKLDRHVIRRLVQAGFLKREEQEIGMPSLFPADSVTALKALSLTSICIYGYGPGSRVDNKNTLFFIARAIYECFANLRTHENREEHILMKDFISVLNNIPLLDVIEIEGGKLSLAGYIKGNEANYVIFKSVPEEQILLVKKTLDKDGMPTIKHFAAAYFYFISILEGNIVEDMYENTKAFMEFMKNKPNASGVDTSITLISDIKPLGEETKSFIPANIDNLKSKTSCLLSMYNDENGLNMLSDASKATSSLTTVLGLLAVLTQSGGNNNDINAWLEFILRCDNQTLWLTKEVAKPALISIGCHIEAFEAKTIFLAAEFMATLGYISNK